MPIQIKYSGQIEIHCGNVELLDLPALMRQAHDHLSSAARPATASPAPPPDNKDQSVREIPPAKKQSRRS